MRLLVAFDGSECSEAALEDLCFAGLPDEVKALVLSVAQAPIGMADTGVPGTGGWNGPIGECDDSRREYGFNQAKSIAAFAQEWLRTEFPRWQVDCESLIDAAGPAIVRRARAWQPDLIVVGSNGRAALSRLLLGSVSQYVMHHAEYPVRICRQHLHFRNRPLMLMIGIDGSQGSRVAGEYVASRHWPAGTQVMVVGVVRSEADSFDLDHTTRGMHLAVEKTARILEESGLHATGRVVQGSPADVLISLVDEHAVDCLFVGASGSGAVKRLWLGSVSSAVAAEAHCSVEIVQQKVSDPVQRSTDCRASTGSESPCEHAGGSLTVVGETGSGHGK